MVVLPFRDTTDAPGHQRYIRRYWRDPVQIPLPVPIELGNRLVVDARRALGTCSAWMIGGSLLLAADQLS
jgi:hypothetical protein